MVLVLTDSTKKTHWGIVALFVLGSSKRLHKSIISEIQSVFINRSRRTSFVLDKMYRQIYETTKTIIKTLDSNRRCIGM